MITLVTDLKISCISDVSRLKPRNNGTATKNNFTEIWLKETNSQGSFTLWPWLKETNYQGSFTLWP